MCVQLSLSRQHSLFAYDAGTDGGSNLVLHKSHYLGFGAAGALLHHLKHDLRLALAPKSFQVSFAMA